MGGGGGGIWGGRVSLKLFCQCDFGAQILTLCRLVNERAFLKQCYQSFRPAIAPEEREKKEK